MPFLLLFYYEFVDNLLHIIRNRCGNAYIFACHRVTKAHFTAVESLSVYQIERTAVQIVAEQRMTEIAHMTADLMRLSCFEHQQDKRVVITAENRLVVRNRGAAALNYMADNL